MFNSSDGNISLTVAVNNETVWLTLDQISALFQRDKSTISRHIRNLFREKELERDATVAKYATVQDEGNRRVEREMDYYNLDVIISVGYRVKSQRGVEFRKWANAVLKDFILKGCAVNENRLRQLGEVVRLMQRTQDSLDSKQVLSVIENYSRALDLLDAYDHQNMQRPAGEEAIYVLTYEECRQIIDKMRFGDESDLFGVEKDASFKGSIGDIYQSFAGVEIYPSLQEKAANLLYFVTKTIVFWMATNGLLLRYLYIFLIGTAFFSMGTVRKNWMIIHW